MKWVLRRIFQPRIYTYTNLFTYVHSSRRSSKSQLLISRVLRLESLYSCSMHGTEYILAQSFPSLPVIEYIFII